MPADSLYGSEASAEVDTAELAKYMEDMRGTILSLSQTYDTLQKQRANVVSNAPTMDGAKQVLMIRKQLVAMDKRQEENVTALTQVIQETVIENIVDHLQQNLQAMVARQVRDRLVAAVAREFDTQFPSPLAQQVIEHKRKLNEVRLSLHNSEARRANAVLRPSPDHLEGPLAPLLRSDGTKSDLFPPTLQKFFQMQVPSLHALMDDFEIQYTNEDSRDRLLNKVMGFVGVTFQIVPAPASRQGPLVTSF